MQLSFEVLQVSLKLIDALSGREYVAAFRVVNAFQHFSELRNLGP